MSKPIIGLTSYSRTDNDRFDLPISYLEAVERAQGVPVVVTPCSKDPQDLAEKLDGVVLTGGGDVDPARYSGENIDEIYGVNKERDQFEIELAKTIIDHGSPLLAICRGIQVLNVALGGTLIEDIPTMVGDQVQHREEGFDKVDHWVEISPDSKLAKICGLTEVMCPSFHHQSARDVAPGFDAVAWSADGVIEAIESRKYPGVIAVQWHPEYVADKVESQQRLFDTFVEWAKNGIPEDF